MNVELSRTPIPDEPGNSIVQRVRNGNYQLLKESVTTTGETMVGDNPLITQETIVITRNAGLGSDF